MLGEKKSVSLDCKVEGYPPPTINWTPWDSQENECDQSILNVSKVQRMGYSHVQRRTVWAMIVQIPALVSLLISFMSDFWAQNFFAGFKIDTIFSLSLMRKLLHNFVKVL